MKQDVYPRHKDPQNQRSRVDRHSIKTSRSFQSNWCLHNTALECCFHMDG